MKYKGGSKYVYIIFVLAMVVVVGNAFGQQSQRPSVEEIVAKIKQDLKLNDDQAVKITPIVQNQIQQMQAIIKQAQEKVRADLQALEQNTEAKLAQVLTPEQMTEFKIRQQQTSPQAAKQPAPQKK